MEEFTDLTQTREQRLYSLLTHFAPLFLAIFCLTLSLANYSVFWGFEEKEPATHASVLLMLLSFIVSFSAIRECKNDTAKRVIALLLCLVTAAAIFDETHQIHEAIGKSARKSIDFLPKQFLYFTDDLLILLGAIAGTIFLYRIYIMCRSHPHLKLLLSVIVVTAVGHGLLDILGHSYTFFRPLLGRMEARSMGDRLSTFEEWLKLWTEYFVFLFLCSFFYRLKTNINWAIQILSGSLIAAAGLWAIRDTHSGVPYLVVGGALEFVRNYDLLIYLITVWSAWALIVWMLFRNNTDHITLAGLFFLCPLFLTLPDLSSSDLVGTVSWFLSRDLFYNILAAENFVTFLLACYVLIVPAIFIALLIVLTQKMDSKKSLLLSAAVFLIPIFLYGIEFNLGAPIHYSGLLIPLALGASFFYRKYRMIIGLLTIMMFLLSSPFWEIVAVLMILTLFLNTLTEPGLSLWKRYIPLIMTIQLVICVFYGIRFYSGLIPNSRIEVNTASLYSNGYLSYEKSYKQKRKQLFQRSEVQK